MGLDFVAHLGCQNWTRYAVCGFCVLFPNAMHDVQIIYCSKIRGSVVTLPSGLPLVLDLTPGVLLSYPDLRLQISNLCIKKMSIKINPSKKDPHNETKGSISWKDFDGQQHDKIYSPGSMSQRSLLRSVVKNCFPGSDFAACANLSQVQSIRNARPLLINKQARAIQRIGNDVLPCQQGKSKKWLQILVEVEFLGKNP